MKRYLLILLLTLSTGAHAAVGLQKHPAKDYVPGELVVRFRAGVELGAASQETQISASAIGRQPASLQDLHRRFKIRGMRRIHQAGRQMTVADLQAKFPNRQKRISTAGAEKAARVRDALERTVIVQVDPGSSLDQAVADYAADPNVEQVSRNLMYHYLFVPNDPYFSSSGAWGQSYRDQWPLEIIKAPAAWDLSTGANVIVAVVDSGVDYNHPDLKDNIWINPNPDPVLQDIKGYNAYDYNGNPMDVVGHGTHVAGTIAAKTNNGVGMAGLAFNARIMAVRAGDQNGGLPLVAIINGMTYATDHGADVINCSFGGPMNEFLQDVFHYAAALGVVIVAAAGNESVDASNTSPANFSEVITVAASDHNDHPADFSNYGSKIDVAAPGGESGSLCDNLGVNSILSLRAGTIDMYQSAICSNGVFLAGKMIVGTHYTRLRGTSMAAPHVAGLAALILSQYPAATPEQVRQIIRQSADDIETPGFDAGSGHGRINALKALQTAPGAALSIKSPRPLKQLATGITTVTGRVDGVTSLAGYQVEVSRASDSHGFIPVSPVMTTPGAFSFSWDAGELSTGRYQLRLKAWDAAQHTYSVTQSPLFRESGVGQLGFVHSLSPRISGDRVVWATNDYENKLMIFNTATQTLKAILAQPTHYFRNVAIDGDLVVYDDRSGVTTFVTLRNLSTGQTKIISAEIYGEAAPAISGTRVVYRDWDHNVFLYDDATGATTQLTTTINGNRNDLGIYGNRVVWEEQLTGVTSRIKVHDLTTGQVQTLPNPERLNKSPMIYGNRVSWTGYEGTFLPFQPKGVHIYNLSTGQMEDLKSRPAGASRDAAFNDTWAAWFESTDEGENLYIKNWQEGTLRQVTVAGDAPPDGQRPQLSARNVVWLRQLEDGDFPYIYDLPGSIAPSRVSITEPAAGARVTGNRRVSVDSPGAWRIWLYANGQPIGETTSSPFQFNWNTNALTPGTYDLVAKAQLKDGSIGYSASLRVQVAANQAPSVSPLKINRTDVDTINPDLQLLSGTPLEISSVASDPDGDLISWKWTRNAQGTTDVTQGSGLTIPPQAFTCPTVQASTVVSWTLDTNDGNGHIDHQSFAVVVLPLPNLHLEFAGEMTAAQNGRLEVAFDPNALVSSVRWTITPRSTASGTRVSAVAQTRSLSVISAGSTLDLAAQNIAAGEYTVLAEALDANQVVIASISGTITITAAGMGRLHVFPSPWRTDLHNGHPLTFEGLQQGSSLKIFTLSGKWIKTIPVMSGQALWNLDTDSGDRAASGLYLYIGKTTDGSDVKGKVGVIR